MVIDESSQFFFHLSMRLIRLKKSNDSFICNEIPAHRSHLDWRSSRDAMCHCRVPSFRVRMLETVKTIFDDHGSVGYRWMPFHFLTEWKWILHGWMIHEEASLGYFASACYSLRKDSHEKKEFSGRISLMKSDRYRLYCWMSQLPDWTQQSNKGFFSNTNKDVKLWHLLGKWKLPPSLNWWILLGRLLAKRFLMPIYISKSYQIYFVTNWCPSMEQSLQCSVGKASCRKFIFALPPSIHVSRNKFAFTLHKNCML